LCAIWPPIYAEISYFICHSSTTVMGLSYRKQITFPGERHVNMREPALATAAQTVFLGTRTANMG
jgi:hypothetical protein